jgi:L-serine dehydratase
MLANGQQEVEFPVDQCMNFHADNLSLHENGMRITALAGDKVLYSQTYYSIGGGFIVDEEHFGQTNDAAGGALSVQKCGRPAASLPRKRALAPA